MTELSVPIPTSFADTRDHFMSILVGAPYFEFLNQCVSYTITLDMMMTSLLSGIDSVISRAKSADAVSLYQQSKAEAKAAHDLYRQGQVTQAQQKIYAAHHLFMQAGKRRGR
jgi:hypothetical protein